MLISYKISGTDIESVCRAHEIGRRQNGVIDYMSENHMNEVKPPKRPLIFYAMIAMLLILLFNMFAVPFIQGKVIRDVDYGTFMTMTDKKEIAEVEIDSSQIIFSDKDGTLYRTGIIEDPDLVERLHESGAVFSSQIQKQMSPILMFFLTWILPILIFWLLGRWLSGRLMDRMGGGDAGSMVFGMG